jgi:hypothetical protein
VPIARFTKSRNNSISFYELSQQSSKKKFRPFRQARAFVRKLGLRSSTEWRWYRSGNRPADIPCNPNVIYRDRGWKGYGDWLGTGTIAPYLRIYRSFREARRFARQLHLASRVWWWRYTKGQLPAKPLLPKDIPANPRQTYRRRGWKGWGDWLGTGNLAPRFRRYRSFAAARRFARGLRLKNQHEWVAYAHGKIPLKPRLPTDIPVWPDGSYRGKGWVSWGDWLGTGSVAPWLKKFRPFGSARKFARSLNLHGHEEWQDYVKGRIPGKPPIPRDIPHDPYFSYGKKGWVNWRDWLGTESARRYRTIVKRTRKGKRFFVRRRPNGGWK